MNDYIPTAVEKALMVYTNAVIDMKHAIKACDKARLQYRANYALAVVTRAEDVFPGWKLPEPQPESCGRCRDRVTYVERGCVFPCHCMIDEMS